MALIPSIPPENFTIGHVYVILLSLIRVIASVSTWFAIASIVWGGVVLIGSSGNEEKTKQGKTIITYAAIGLAITLLAWVLVSQVLKLIGAKCPFEQNDIQKLVETAPPASSPDNARANYLSDLASAIHANPECINITIPTN